MALSCVILNLFQNLKIKSKKCHITLPKLEWILRQERRQSLSCINHAQNDREFKIRTNSCHPEGRARRISKENEQRIFCFAQNNKKCAFTLAEVLITLGIIGIVAAMTLPAIIGKYEKKLRETQLKEAYSILNQAYKKSILDNGDPAGWDYDIAGYEKWDGKSNQWLEKYLFTYMSVKPVKNAKEYNEEHKLWNFTKESYTRRTMDKTYHYVTPQGWTISPRAFLTYGPLHYGMYLLIDFDGVKGKNQLGYDIFAFVIYNVNNHLYDVATRKYIKLNPGVHPVGDLGCVKGSYIGGSGATGSYNGWGCSGDIAKNNWIIPKDYPW